MKYLPLVMTRGPLLAEAMQSAALHGDHPVLCGYCGVRMPQASTNRRQKVQCPGCLRQIHINAQEETPWRLTPLAADALRRSRTWLRRL